MRLDTQGLCLLDHVFCLLDKQLVPQAQSMALHLSTIEKTKVIASDSNLGLLVTPADFGPRSQRMLCKA